MFQLKFCLIFFETIVYYRTSVLCMYIITRIILYPDRPDFLVTYTISLLQIWLKETTPLHQITFLKILIWSSPIFAEKLVFSLKNWGKITNFLINFVQFFNNQQNLQIIERCNRINLGVHSPHPPQVCYHWLQMVEKIKLNLMTEDWLCVMQKLGGQKHQPAESPNFGDATSAYKELEMQGMQLHLPNNFLGSKID